MGIQNFTSFFEIFTVFNLSYITIKPFTEAINNIVISSFNYRLNKTNSLLDEEIVELKSAHTYSENAQLKDLISEADVFASKIEDIAKLNNQIYDEQFRTIYFTCGLFGMFALILGGYGVTTTNYNFANYWLFYCLSFTSTYLIIIYVLTFIPKFRLIRVGHNSIGFIIIIFCAYYCAFTDWWYVVFTKESTLIIWSIILVMSPFKLHYIRVVSIRFYSIIRLRRIQKKMNRLTNNKRVLLSKMFTDIIKKSIESSKQSH